jgi:hypothetical protein
MNRLVGARQITFAGTHDACQVVLLLFESSFSLLDYLGRVRRVKAKPHAVASRASTQRPRPEGRQLSRRTGEDQDTAISIGRTAGRRAISRAPACSGVIPFCVICDWQGGIALLMDAGTPPDHVGL